MSAHAAGAALACVAAVVAVIVHAVETGPSPPSIDRSLGAVADEAEVDFLVDLRLPNEAGLQRFLRDVSDPTSTRYRGFIDDTAFGWRFGVGEPEIRRLRRQLRREGFVVGATDRARTYLEVRGTARALRRAFGVRIGRYRDRLGRPFNAPTTDVVIPPGLADVVAGVGGLDTRRPETDSLPGRFGFKPADLARAYDISPLWRAGVLGQGQAIAIYSWSTFDDHDVASFDQQVGIPGKGVCAAGERSGCILRRPVAGGVDGVTDLEDSLDVEVAHGIAPEALVLNYEVPCCGEQKEWPRAFVTSSSASSTR